MQIFSWQFKPSLWPTIAVVLLLPILLRLGFWQLDRANQKDALQKQYLSRSAGTSTVDLNKASGTLRDDPKGMQWQLSTARGSFNTKNIFLLDNQVMRRQAGYFVYAAFSLTNEERKILVNYGWVPVGDDRAKPPAVVLPEGELIIEGLAKKVPATGIKLAEIEEESLGNGFYRVQDIEIETLAGDRAWTLFPYVLRLAPPAPEGFVRDWIEPGFGKEKHLGYAFQWFALAVALLIIFLVVNLKRIEEE